MDLPREEVENIRTAALLHDIGKVEVSGQLIRKAAELTTEEKSKVATHTRKGAELLMSVGSVLKDAVPLVLHHHTYYGQPSGEGSAARADVPLGAHIIGVADAYDAIITDRAYRKGRTPREALEEIERSTPRQFHPDVVGALRRVMLNLREEKEALVWAPTAPARASSSS
jgi:HD-GYP domain-containing protein (c-di-GMP phosphodiesterase class II)